MKQSKECSMSKHSGMCKHVADAMKKSAKPKTMYYGTLIKGKSPTSPNLQLVGNAKIDKLGLHLDGEGDMARVKVGQIPLLHIVHASSPAYPVHS
jgi:hypothetical protein